MPPIGSSFRSIMRGNSSSESSTLSDENEIQMQGWMRKQKETLRSWARRYFTLNGKVLTYYDSEDTSRGARGILEFVDVTALTTENNGLALHLVNGKERTSKNRTSKEGWAHCLTDDDVWTRFFVVIKHDSFSCYESEDDDAELALSGLIRAVDEWDGKRFGVVCSLNRSRTIKLCFDSAEEKMSWFLTLEFSGLVRRRAHEAGGVRQEQRQRPQPRASARTHPSRTWARLRPRKRTTACGFKLATRRGMEVATELLKALWPHAGDLRPQEEKTRPTLLSAQLE
ncbi:hypothetical protein PRIC2_011904 [Phytophthora ramorum]